MPEQGEDLLLLGPGAPQGRAHCPALYSPFRLRSRRDVCENVAVRHGAILSVATAHAPPPPKPHSGDITSWAGSAGPRSLRQHWYYECSVCSGSPVLSARKMRVGVLIYRTPMA